MITLLAHHMEPQHFPVLAAILAAGAWIGWTLAAKFLRRRAQGQ